MAAGFATEVCIRSIVTGTPVRDLFDPGFLMRNREAEDGAIHVQSFVWMTEPAEPRACTVTASSGDRDDLREAVLTAFQSAGTEAHVLQDSGPGSRDSSGDYRQEAHCVSVEGQPLAAVLSTSTEDFRRPLLFTVLRDREGICARAD